MAASTNQFYKLGVRNNRARRKVLGSTTIYDGTLVFLVAASGFATNSIASGANRFGGVALALGDNSAGANGAVEIECAVTGSVTLVNCSHSLALADVEKPIYASDNHTLTTSSSSTTLIGHLEDIDANGDPIIRLNG